MKLAEQKQVEVGRCFTYGNDGRHLNHLLRRKLERIIVDDIKPRFIFGTLSFHSFHTLAEVL